MISEATILDCSNKLILHLGNDGFRFIGQNNNFPDDTKSNKNKNIASSVVANALFGLVFGPFSWNITSSEDTLYKDLKSLSDCGVIAGYKKSFGVSYLATIFDTSNLSDESIIGRFAIIHENIIPFQKYSIGINSIFSDGRIVQCKTYLLFTEKYRSDNFILNISKQCKYTKHFSGAGNFPVVIDLYNKKVFEKNHLFNKFSESNSYNIF
jgi:hypothetical protein